MVWAEGQDWELNIFVCLKHSSILTTILLSNFDNSHCYQNITLSVEPWSLCWVNSRYFFFVCNLLNENLSSLWSCSLEEWRRTTTRWWKTELFFFKGDLFVCLFGWFCCWCCCFLVCGIQCEENGILRYLKTVHKKQLSTWEQEWSPGPTTHRFPENSDSRARPCLQKWQVSGGHWPHGMAAMTTDGRKWQISVNRIG